MLSSAGYGLVTRQAYPTEKHLHCLLMLNAETYLPFKMKLLFVIVFYMLSTQASNPHHCSAS